MAKKKKTKRKGDGAESDVFGRPSKYSKRFCEMLEAHMAEGGSFYSFGAVIDVDQSTLHRWVENHEEFCESKSRGELKSLKFHEDLAKAQMTGSLRRIKSETKSPDGTIKKEYAFVKGDGHVWGVTMRAQFRKFGYTNSMEITGKGGGPVRVKNVSDMTDEELDKENAELDEFIKGAK